METRAHHRQRKARGSLEIYHSQSETNPTWTWRLTDWAHIRMTVRLLLTAKSMTSRSSCRQWHKAFQAAESGSPAKLSCLF